MSSSFNFLIIAIVSISCVYCYLQDNPQFSQSDLQPRNLRISQAAESVVIGKKKNNDTFGGTVHLFQFADG